VGIGGAGGKKGGFSRTDRRLGVKNENRSLQQRELQKLRERGRDDSFEMKNGYGLNLKEEEGEGWGLNSIAVAPLE